MQTSQLDRIAIAYGQTDPHGAFPATKKLPAVANASQTLPPQKEPPHESIKEAKETQRKLAAAERELEELRAELELMRTGFEGKIEVLEGKRSLEGERYGHALEEAEAAAARREEQEKLKRVELLRRQIVRRIMNQGTRRGWQAWHEMWQAKSYALGRLRQVAGRLQKPQRESERGSRTGTRTPMSPIPPIPHVPCPPHRHSHSHSLSTHARTHAHGCLHTRSRLVVFCPRSASFLAAPSPLPSPTPSQSLLLDPPTLALPSPPVALPSPRLASLWSFCHLGSRVGGSLHHRRA